VTLAAISDNILGDSASAVGLLIAFYYGLTGFTSVWFFRNDRGSGIKDLTVRIILPLLGGLMLFAAFIKTVVDNADAANSYTEINLFGWHTGGIFVLSVGSLLLGIVLMYVTQWRSPAYFTGTVLNRDTPVRVFEDESIRVLAPTLPDAPSLEQTVVPPMSIEDLREAAAEGREERAEGREDHDGEHDA